MRKLITATLLAAASAAVTAGVGTASATVLPLSYFQFKTGGVWEPGTYLVREIDNPNNRCVYADVDGWGDRNERNVRVVKGRQLMTFGEGQWIRTNCYFTKDFIDLGSALIER